MMREKTKMQEEIAELRDELRSRKLGGGEAKQGKDLDAEVCERLNCTVA